MAGEIYTKIPPDLGIPTTFDPNRADFSGITRTEIIIGAARHRASVEVDERGTEAAGTTSIKASYDINEFNANHPFVFIIRDDYTGNMLFMGRVNKPLQGD